MTIGWISNNEPKSIAHTKNSNYKMGSTSWRCTFTYMRKCEFPGRSVILRVPNVLTCMTHVSDKVMNRLFPTLICIIHFRPDIPTAVNHSQVV